MLARNVRSGPGEIDLLVALAGRIVAVEVKTRIGDDPMLSMTAEKERRLGEAVSRLRPRPHRLDVVAVRFDAGGASIRWLRDVG